MQHSRSGGTGLTAAVVATPIIAASTTAPGPTHACGGGGLARGAARRDAVAESGAPLSRAVIARRVTARCQEAAETQGGG